MSSSGRILIDNAGQLLAFNESLDIVLNAIDVSSSILQIHDGALEGALCSALPFPRTPRTLPHSTVDKRRKRLKLAIEPL